MYHFIKKLDKNCFGTDIASSKLWLASFLLKLGDNCRSLQKVNDVLSSIPPYALYYSRGNKTNEDSEGLYRHIYSFRNSSTICRAKEAWLIDIYISKNEYSLVPRAIQIELDYCDPTVGVWISPFTYAYYLMFMCYHGLGQQGNRDHALRQLVDTVNDGKRCSVLRHHSYNIAGHCMLMVGNVATARELFFKSAYLTHNSRPKALDEYNAAYKYLTLL